MILLHAGPCRICPSTSSTAGADMTETQGIDAALLQRLRTLLGHRCEYDGQVWRLIDILPGEGLAVLESDLARPPIQMDQYGRASHRANAILEIRILDPAEDALTPEMQDLIDCLESMLRA